MTYDRQNIGRFCLPIKLANTNLSCVMQIKTDKSSNFMVQHSITRSILNDKIGQLFGYRSTHFLCYHCDCLQWEIKLYFSCFVYYCIIFIFVH